MEAPEAVSDSRSKPINLSKDSQGGYFGKVKLGSEAIKRIQLPSLLSLGRISSNRQKKRQWKIWSDTHAESHHRNESLESAYAQVEPGGDL